jgi:hypothetical protein
MISANRTRHDGQLRKSLGRVDPQRGHGHDSSKGQMLRGSDTVRELYNAISRYAAAPLTR